MIQLIKVFLSLAVGSVVLIGFITFAITLLSRSLARVGKEIVDYHLKQKRSMLLGLAEDLEEAGVGPSVTKAFGSN